MALTNLLSMNELTPLFTRAQQGDPDAQEQLRQLGPGLTESSDQKPENVMGSLQGGGLATSLVKNLPGAQLAGPQSAQPLHANAGGEGVTVQDQDQGGKKRDWGSMASGLAVALTDIGNAFGNPRARMEGGGYQLALENLKSQQLESLKRRHEMWQSTYEQAQQLPPEVYTDPKFSGLASAAQALQKDAANNKIDNEKSVSNFLLELKRHQRELEGAVQQAQVSRQLAGEQQLGAGREADAARTIQELQGRVASGGPDAEQAQLTLSTLKQPFNWEGTLTMMTPNEYAAKSEQREQYRDTLKERERGHQETAAYHRLISENNRLNAQDRLGQQRRLNVSKGLDAMLTQTSKQYSQKDMFGETKYTPEQVQALTMRQHTGDIVAAAKEMGLRVDERPDLGVISINGQPYKVDEALPVLIQQIHFGGGGS